MFCGDHDSKWNEDALDLHYWKVQYKLDMHYTHNLLYPDALNNIIPSSSVVKSRTGQDSADRGLRTPLECISHPTNINLTLPVEYLMRVSC